MKGEAAFCAVNIPNFEVTLGGSTFSALRELEGLLQGSVTILSDLICCTFRISLLKYNREKTTPQNETWDYHIDFCSQYLNQRELLIAVNAYRNSISLLRAILKYSGWCALIFRDDY